MPTNSLERTLALLELLEQTPGGLRNAEICRRLKIPASTASYILTRLEQHGYLQRDPDTRCYQIGLRVVALAHGALRDLGFRAISEPVLYRLSGETGLSAGIGIWQGNCVLRADRVEGREFLKRTKGARDLDGRSREQRDIGRELPIHSTSFGKVLLASLAPEAREKLLLDLKLERYTPKTIVSHDRLLAEVEAVQQQGYATSVEEQYLGVRSLCVPVVDASGSVIAAVAVNGGTLEPVWQNQKALIDLLKIAAVDISRRAPISSIGK